jgi:transposase-like protein
MPFPLAVRIELSGEGRARLEAWERRRMSAQALALRSRIVFAAAEGSKSSEIACEVGIAVSSVRTWRNRLAEHRLAGLSDEPRPGQPRKISDAKVEGLSEVLCEVGVTDAARGAGKAIHDQAEDQVQWGWVVWVRAS